MTLCLCSPFHLSMFQRTPLATLYSRYLDSSTTGFSVCSLTDVPSHVLSRASDKVAKLSTDARDKASICASGSGHFRACHVFMFFLSALFYKTLTLQHVFTIPQYLAILPRHTEAVWRSVCLGNLLYFGHLSFHIPVMLPYMQIMKPDTLAS